MDTGRFGHLAAKREVTAGTHYLHAGHSGVVTSHGVPGGRQSESEMTPGEQENWLTYFLPFLLLQLGDNLGHSVVFQQGVFGLLPAQRRAQETCLLYWWNMAANTRDGHTLGF